MSGWGFVDYWWLGLGIAVVVVLLVAALLLVIIMTARQILANATHALGVANEIVANTQPIWALETTNLVAVHLLDGAKAIEEHTGQIADTLEASATQR
jgi:hypothetical protein